MGSRASNIFVGISLWFLGVRDLPLALQVPHCNRALGALVPYIVGTWGCRVHCIWYMGTCTRSLTPQLKASTILLISPAVDGVKAHALSTRSFRSLNPKTLRL